MKIACLAVVWCICLLCLPGTGIASPVELPHYECVLEKDNAPALDENSEAHALFMRVQKRIKSKPPLTPEEETQLFSMCQKAARMGHWRAEATLVKFFAYGIGTEQDGGAAVAVAMKLAKAELPVGYFSLGALHTLGIGVVADEAKGMELIHTAAARGYADAQYFLGEDYLHGKRDTSAGLKYHVCAMRQGHARATAALATFLMTEGNTPMYAEYALRAAGQGDQKSLPMLRLVFDSPEDLNLGQGFDPNPAFVALLDTYAERLGKDPELRFPAIGKECPLPMHPRLGNGSQLPSKLKDAFGGKWPDEVFVDLQNW